MSDGGACPNCGVAVLGVYCHACGQAQRVEHSAYSILGKTASDLAHLDHVLARTLVDLVRRPGGLIADVLRGKTKPYAKPIATLLLVASTVFLFMRWSGLSEAMRELQTTKGQRLDVVIGVPMREFVMQWGQYMNLASVPVAAASSWLLEARRRPYAHWLVFHAYAAAGTSVITLLVMPWFIGHPAVYAGVMVALLPVFVAYVAWCARGAFGHGPARALFAVGLPTQVVHALVSIAISFGYLIFLFVRMAREPS